MSNRKDIPTWLTKDIPTWLVEEIIDLLDTYPLFSMTSKEIKQLIKELQSEAQGYIARADSLENTVAILERYLDTQAKD
jgi:hypothetical protein